MRGDAVFGDLVHVAGADLQLDALLAGPDHGGVDRAVVVLLWRRDVVLEPRRHHRPGGVDDAERLVALGHRLHHDAEADDVRELLEAHGLALHLAPNRIGALAASGDVRHDAAVAELACQLLLDFRHQTDVAILQGVQTLADHRVGVGIELAERQVLELLAQLVHAHAAGERRIDVDGFLGGTAARLRRHVADGAHVVQAVGELHQQHAHVVGDGQEELAQVFRLLRLLGDEIELGELGQAFDQAADVLAEKLVDLGPGGVGILDGVVQQRRGDGRIVELEVGQDRRNLERMGEIGVAGGPLLLAMGLHGVDIGAIQQRLVGIGVVAAHPVDQVVLAHHLHPRRPLRFRSVINGLRDDLAAALDRGPGPGLILHTRQIGRGAGHDHPGAGGAYPSASPT